MSKTTPLLHSINHTTATLSSILSFLSLSSSLLIARLLHMLFMYCLHARCLSAAALTCTGWNRTGRIRHAHPLASSLSHCTLHAHSAQHSTAHSSFHRLFPPSLPSLLSPRLDHCSLHVSSHSHHTHSLTRTHTAHCTRAWAVIHRHRIKSVDTSGVERRGREREREGTESDCFLFSCCPCFLLVNVCVLLVG